MTLIGTNVVLRPHRRDDIQTRVALGRDPEIHRMYGGSVGQPFTESDAAGEIEKWMSHPHAWAIDYQGRYIGGIRLNAVNETDRNVRLAIGIADPACLGRGLGSEAVRLALGYAFDTLKLHRVYLRVLAYNERAMRSYEKCGFRIEGRERESALIDGNWHDDVIMGILNRECHSRASGNPGLTNSGSPEDDASP